MISVSIGLGDKVTKRMQSGITHEGEIIYINWRYGWYMARFYIPKTDSWVNECFWIDDPSRKGNEQII